MKKHEDMKAMKQIRPATENICFVTENPHKTKFIGSSFGIFASYCFILFMFLSLVYTAHHKT